MRTFLLVLGAVCAAATLSPTRADDARTASFTLAGDDFVFPYPDGYCAPTGRYAERAQMVAAADTVNTTELSYFTCDDEQAGREPIGWGTVKSPAAGMAGPIPPRDQLIDQIRAHINPADLKKIMEQASQKANEGIHETLSKGVNVAVDMKPLDADAVAAYVGGTVAVTLPNGSQKLIATVFAATEIKGHVFFVYLFRAYNGPSDIAEMIAQLKPIAAAFVNANGG